MPFLDGKLATDEQRALQEIIDNADIIIVEGEPWLLVRPCQPTLDALAAFDAEAEDRENDLEDEEEPYSESGSVVGGVFMGEDCESEADLEYDYVHACPGDAEPILAGGRNVRLPETPNTATKAIIELAQPK